MTKGIYMLDPEDWDEFRSAAHRVLDGALDKMESD